MQYFGTTPRSKKRVQQLGDVRNNELILKGALLSMSPSLAIKLTAVAYQSQLKHVVAFDIHADIYCYKDKVIMLDRGKFIFDSGLREKTTRILIPEADLDRVMNESRNIGSIVDRKLIFHTEPPSKLFTVTSSYGYDYVFALNENDNAAQCLSPVLIGGYAPTSGPIFVYHNKIVTVDGTLYPDGTTLTEIPEEDLILVKHYVLKQEKGFDKMKAQVMAYEKFEMSIKAKREPIAEEIRMFVWRRDQGMCVKCSSQTNLEFDHIIPISRGGSSTARNIQLLCEACNRSKSDSI